MSPCHYTMDERKHFKVKKSVKTRTPKLLEDFRILVSTRLKQIEVSLVTITLKNVFYFN